MRRFVKLIPFLFFRLGLFAVWRLIPRAVRRRVVAATLGRGPERQGRLRRPAQPVVVAGMLRSTTSFGWAARITVDLLRRAGLPVFGVDIGASFAANHLSDNGMVPEPASPSVLAGPATLIIHLNPDQFRYAAAFLPRSAFERKYVIAYCAWELERIPAEWVDALSLVDEVWVPSAFVGTAFRNSGVALPCRVVPHFLEAPADLQPDRRRFGIPEGCFVVMTAFSLRSGLSRKNPEAAVEAFLRAFPDDEAVRLVVKVSDIDVEESTWTALRAAIKDDPRIIYVSDFLENAGMWTLIASCDVVLSTHRAEGFGMIPAQAMLLGRAVAATAWSGNLDYMNDNNAELLPYRLVPVDDPEGRYAVPGAVWAEVDTAATATALRRLHDDPGRREALAAEGKRSIEGYLAGHRERLIEDIGQWRKTEEPSR